jgi:hypothetical protein
LLSFSQAAASQVPYAVQQLLAQAMSQLQQLGIGNRFSLQLGILPDDAQGPAGERRHVHAMPARNNVVCS